MKFKHKIKKKQTQSLRDEPGSFASEVGVLPTERIGNISNMEYIIDIKIENMLYGLWEKF